MGFRTWGLKCEVWHLRILDLDLGFSVQGKEFEVGGLRMLGVVLGLWV